MPFPQPTDDLSAAADDLDRHGYCLVADALDHDALEHLRRATSAEAQADRTADVAHVYSRERSQRVWCLPRRGDVFVRLACHPTALALAAHVLDDDVLLSNLSANIVGPGGDEMVPHSDQEWAPRPWPHPLAMHVLWMIDAFTAENGATLLMPGSHRCPHTDVRWAPVAAEGPAGTALAFDARVLHGTGANRSRLGRMGILAYYCRGFVRQQENFARSLSPDAIAEWPEDLRSLFGFTFHPEYLGMVNGPPSELPRY